MQVYLNQRGRALVHEEWLARQATCNCTCRSTLALQSLLAHDHLSIRLAFAKYSARGNRGRIRHRTETLVYAQTLKLAGLERLEYGSPQITRLPQTVGQTGLAHPTIPHTPQLVYDMVQT